MKVYVVKSYDDEGSSIDEIFASEDAANAHVEAECRRSYDEGLRTYEGRKALAERWVKAGGGLTTALVPPASYELHRAAWPYEVEEYEVRE